MANTVLEEDVSSGKVGAHRRVLGGVRGPDIGETWQQEWRTWSEQD